MSADIANLNSQRMKKSYSQRNEVQSSAQNEGLNALLPSDIDKLNAKHRETWNRVWPSLWPIALKKACKLLENEDRAYEAATDVLGDLYKNEGGIPLEDGNHLRRRVLIAVRNRCNTEYRSNKVRNNKWRIVAISEDLYGRVKNVVATPSTDAQRKELKEFLRELINRLRKDEYRVWIDDHILKGMTIDEIVSRYNRPRGTVSGYIDRAKSALLTMATADPRTQEFKESYYVKDFTIEDDHSKTQKGNV